MQVFVMELVYFIIFDEGDGRIENRTTLLQLEVRV